MLLEYGDDDVLTWGWPWHGLIDSVNGLHHPQKPLPYEAIRGGGCTSLFDLGLGSVVTPAEVAAQEGELWPKAILNWSLNEGTSRARSAGFGLPGAPITRTRDGVKAVGAWVLAELRSRTIQDGRKVVDIVFRSRTPSNFYPQPGSSVSQQIRSYTWADFGQGDDQPGIEVFAWSTAWDTLGPVQVLRWVFLDVRDNRLLFGITADFSLTSSGQILDFLERPPLLLGLIELAFEFTDDEEPSPYISDVNVVMDRAAALGTLTRAESGGTWQGPTQDWYPTTVVSDTRDPVACTGAITATAPGGWTPTPGASVLNRESRDDTAQHYSIKGGLLLARYGEDGAIETARYDAEYSLSRNHLTTIENGGSHEQRSERRSTATVCREVLVHVGVSYVTFSQQEFSELRFRQAIYGFDGELTDSDEFNGVTLWEKVRRITRMTGANLEDETETLSETPYTRTLTINGTSTTFTDSTPGAARPHFGANPVARGQALLTGSCIRIGPTDGWGRPSIWRLSNCLACIVRKDATTGFLTAGPAVTPNGADPASYPSTCSFSNATEVARASTFLNGAWNPVTGEVARCAEDRWFSWA